MMKSASSPTPPVPLEKRWTKALRKAIATPAAGPRIKLPIRIGMAEGSTLRKGGIKGSGISKYIRMVAMVANMAVTVILRVRTEVFIRDAPFFQLAVLENKKPALSKARAQMAKIDTEMIRRLFRAEPRDCARHLFLSSGLYRRFRNHTGIGLSKRLADLWHTAHYRRWGITPRPETAYLHYSAGLFCCQEKFQEPFRRGEEAR